jgi:hypothetical protein
MSADQPGYKIAIDAAQRLVRIDLFGFWDDATLARYKADVRRLAAAAAHSPWAGQGTRVLLDMREHVLLSKDRAESLQQELGTPNPADRTAILVANTGLLKMQAGRVAGARKPEFFVAEDEALKWLLRA